MAGRYLGGASSAFVTIFGQVFVAGMVYEAGDRTTVRACVLLCFCACMRALSLCCLMMVYEAGDRTTVRACFFVRAGVRYHSVVCVYCVIGRALRVANNNVTHPVRMCLCVHACVTLLFYVLYIWACVRVW